MEEFIKKGIDIQTITTEELNNQYEKMVKNHQSYLYKNITSIIQKHTRGISSTEIESLIDRYLLIDLKYRGRETIDNLCEGLTKDITKIFNNTKNKDKLDLLKLYFEYINPTIRRNQMDWLYEIINQFTKQIIKKINLHSSAFKGISDDNIKRTIDNLSKELEHLMKSYQEKYNEEYQQILNEFTKKNKSQITELINEFDLNNKKIENLEMYSAIMELSNHELIQENNKFYVQDKSNKEKIELIFKDGMLCSKDNKIRYHVDSKNERIGYYNQETKVIILIHNNLITLIPPKDKNQKESVISFKKKTTRNGNVIDRNYQLFYNLKQISDPEKLKSMIGQIIKYAPGIYSKLVSDPDFKKIAVYIKKQLKIKENTNNQATTQSEIQNSKETSTIDVSKENNNLKENYLENNPKETSTSKKLSK